jgi:hypothetical protein
MTISNFPEGVSSFGIPQVGDGVPTIGTSTYLFVNQANGADGNPGTVDQPMDTIQAAVTRGINTTPGGCCIMAAPGQYDESVVIPRFITLPDGSTRDVSNVMIVGLGGRGAAFIDNDTVGGEGMKVSADDVTLVNLGVAGEATADYSLRVTGSRFRAYGCKFEGNEGVAAGNAQALIGPGTAAEEAANTEGRGGDAILRDCEVCWGARGVVIQSSTFGAATQVSLQGTRFHDLTAVHVGENDVGAIGAGRDIELLRNVHDRDEAGAAPTDWIDLDSAGTTGLIALSVFASAAAPAAGVVQIAAGVFYVTNYSEAGQTVARPA